MSYSIRDARAAWGARDGEAGRLVAILPSSRHQRDSLPGRLFSHEVVARIMTSTNRTPNHAFARTAELAEGPFPCQFPFPAERGGRSNSPVLAGATATGRLTAKTRKYTPQDSNLLPSVP